MLIISRQQWSKGGSERIRLMKILISSNNGLDRIVSGSDVNTVKIWKIPLFFYFLYTISSLVFMN